MNRWMSRGAAWRTALRFSFGGFLIGTLLLLVSSFVSAPALAERIPSNQTGNRKSDPSFSGQIRETLKASAQTIRLIENKGQWAPEILFAFTTADSQVLVEANQLHFQIFHRVPERAGKDEPARPRGVADTRVEMHSFTLSFIGSNAAPQIERGKMFGTQTSYFQGSDPSRWVSDVRAYDEVTLREVYPGISLRLYSQPNQQLEYDWIVSPGADYQQVRLRVEGQDSLAVMNDGSLQVGLRFGDVRFDLPEAYQVTPDGKVRVPFSFVERGDDCVGFETNAELHSQYALVIDPSLAWGTWFDGNSSSFDAYLFATDVDQATGQVYCAGYVAQGITDAAYTAAFNKYDNHYEGGKEAVLYVLSSDGKQLLRATYYGSTGDEIAYGLALSTNNVFMVGEGGTGLPMTAGTFDNHYESSQDGFVAVFPKDLSALTYASYIGGSGTDRMNSVLAFSDNSYVIAGLANDLSSSSPNYFPNYADNTRSGQEGYIARFTSFSTMAFGTYVGGSGSDFINDIHEMSDGRIAFSGHATSTASFPSEVNSQAAAGSANYVGFLGTLPSGGGSFQYLDLIGGSGDDLITGLAVDGDTLYFTGSTQSNDFPLGSGTPFDNTRSTDSEDISSGTPIGDMVIGKVTVPSSGSPSGYSATFFGCTSGCGTNQGTIGLVINIYQPSCSAAKYLMVFGAREGSGTIPTQNIGNELFYNNTNQGSIDLLITVMSEDLSTVPFATLAGGKYDDYFGSTGSPRGSNHLAVYGDKFIVATTSHSASNPTHTKPHKPQLIGDASGSQAAGSVFDPIRSDPESTSADQHIIFEVTFVNNDYGDAPASYGTTTARHLTSCIASTSLDSLRLGSLVDSEGAGLPTSTALGDNDAATSINSAGNDEDGVSLTNVLRANSTTYSASATVLNNTGSDADLYGWIDFDRDGLFETTERAHVVVSTNASSQQIALNWSGLSGGSVGQSYARFRLTTGAIAMNAPSQRAAGFAMPNADDTNDPLAIGVAPNGEMEDYPLFIYAPTAADLVSFKAKIKNTQAQLVWKTGQELNTVGFQVWRRVGNNDWVLMTPELIPATNLGTADGATYRFNDKNVKAGKTYRYKIKLIHADNSETWSDVMRLQVPK